MTRLEALNRKMLDLEASGDVTEEEYATYRALLNWLEFSTAFIGDRLPVKVAQLILEKLHLPKQEEA